MIDGLDPLEVRLDGAGLQRDVQEMRAVLEDGLAAGADSAGRGIETALRRAARTGRVEFEDLARAAGRALGEIAAAAMQLDGGGGGAASLMTRGLSGLLGLPGRATGGPVGPGRAYVVGERGPELFVPQSSGRVEAMTGQRAGVHVTVNVAAPREAGTTFMAQTGKQVARSVRRALERAG